MDGKGPSVGRRGFLNWFLGGAISALGAAVLYPISRFLSPPRVPEATTNQVEAGAADDPEFAEKGYKIIRFGTEPVILLKAAEGDFRAFAATCTHLDCIVEYQKKERRIFCNCHGGEYDLTGRNVAGPPPRPLKHFEVRTLASTEGRAATLVVARV